MLVERLVGEMVAQSRGPDEIFGMSDDDLLTNIRRFVKEVDTKMRDNMGAMEEATARAAAASRMGKLKPLKPKDLHAIPPAKRKSELRRRLIPLVRALIPKVAPIIPAKALALRAEMLSDAILADEEECGWPKGGVGLLETMRDGEALERVLRWVCFFIHAMHGVYSLQCPG